MSLGYTKKLGLKVWKANIGAQKIDSSILKIFRMVIAHFYVKNNADRSRFF